MATTSYRSDKLERAGNEAIQGNSGAFAARWRDGSVSCWGNNASGGDSSSVQSRLKGVKALCASWGTEGAFAAIVGDDNTVVCWGNKAHGGDCSAVVSELTQVEGICGSYGAFAALKRDGTVTTWGRKDYGGDSSAVRHRLKGVKAIYSTYHAFAAVLHDGSVVAWGQGDHGGLIAPSVKGRLKQVQWISGASSAFAALLSDGTVETWGSEYYGGDKSKLMASFWKVNQLTQVVSICASWGAFAALKKDGTVVCWGDEGSGGSRGRATELKEVVAISSTVGAFAALRSDGRVVTWGNPSNGGDNSSVAGQLREVVAIRGTLSAFAALRTNGTVVTWGDKDSGGDSSAVREELVGVMALSSNGHAFAAQKSDGTVVTWGDKDYGGDSSSATENRVLFGSAVVKNEAWKQKREQERLLATQEAKVMGEESEREQREQVMAEEALKKSEEAEAKAQQEREALRENEKIEAERAERSRELAAAQERQRQEWEQEKSRLEQEKETRLRELLWQEDRSTVAVDGSVAFWSRWLEGVLDAEDIADSASKFSAAGFKQKHVGELSQDDLKEAGVKQGVIKDFLNNRHLIGSLGDVPFQSSTSLLAALPKILEEELTMEEEVGEGAFSVVWRATWTRKIAVGKQLVSSMQVAVKMSNRTNSNKNKNSHNSKSQNFGLSNELARDLAVISGLPHQNILTVHGVCEPSSSTSKTTTSGGGGGGLKIVYELMTTDLANYLKEAIQEQTQRSVSSQNPQNKMTQPSQLLPNHVLLRVLRDVSAGLAHLHSHGVVHRDVKPANVLLRDEQVKLCDFGSSRDLQHTLEEMSVAGTLSYMSPEMLNQQPTGRPADVWSFGVLLFECVTGVPCSRAQSTKELATELSEKRKCLPALVRMFVECHQADPRKRPSMHNIHTRLQTLVMQEARDSQRLKQELKRAEAQDKETYDMTWDKRYGNQPHSQELEYLKQKDKEQSAGLVVRQPLKLSKGKGSMEELEQVATAKLCSRLHARLRAIVEKCGGIYKLADPPRKSRERCVQKVEQECDGDYSKLLDLERATGLFEQAEDMLRCLQFLRGEGIQDMTDLSSADPFSFSKLSSVSLRVVRCKDRMNKPLSSGYRDILLNVRDVETGFVMELQLNFHEIAQIKSQSHRFYELVRVMEIKLAP